MSSYFQLLNTQQEFYCIGISKFMVKLQNELMALSNHLHFHIIMFINIKFEFDFNYFYCYEIFSPFEIQKFIFFLYFVNQHDQLAELSYFTYVHINIYIAANNL